MGISPKLAQTVIILEEFLKRNYKEGDIIFGLEMRNEMREEHPFYASVFNVTNAFVVLVMKGVLTQKDKTKFIFNGFKSSDKELTNHKPEMNDDENIGRPKELSGNK